MDGCCWNKKRVHRVYCDMGLNMPRRCKKRLPDRPRQPLGLVNTPNCSMVHPMPYGWTMGRNWSHRCSPNGQRPKVSPSNISSQASKPNQTKPNQNAFIERFNRTYRTEVLDAYLFTNLEQVQTITDQWLVDYNEYRPHEALGNIPPVQFMPRLTRVPNLYRTMST